METQKVVKWDIGDVYDMLPLTNKTLTKQIAKGSLPFVLKNDGGHPCEYYLKDENNEDIGMVKYYRGRKICCYAVHTKTKTKKVEQNKQAEGENYED